MSHGPGVTAMSIYGLFLCVNVIFEGVGGASSFSCHSLVICRFVTLDLSVKCARRKWCQLLFFGELEILTVRSTFWLAGHRVVVSLKNLMDELYRLRTCLPFPARKSEMGKQPNEAASILIFRIPIEFSPTTFGPYWNGCCTRVDLHLFVIIIPIRVDHSIAKNGSYQINIPRLLKERSPFWSKAGSALCGS